MAVLFALTLVASSMFSLCLAENYTVTDEAWFDIQIADHDSPGEDFHGRFVIALFGITAPMTVMNFAAITRGYKRGNEKLHYKNTFIHRIVPDFVIQMGDITLGDGSGGRSIYGEKFNDEDFILSHKAAGYVSMANHGKDTNGSQFFIILNKARWLDGKHVVFGKVIKGMDVINTIADVPSDPASAIPKKKIKIVDCGLNSLDRKYMLTEEEAASNHDIA